MKNIIVLAGLALILSSPVSANDIQALCEARHGTDYRMQQHCVDQQTQAVSVFNASLETLKTSKVGTNIVAHCGDKWIGGRPGGPPAKAHIDWSMVVYCIDQQTEAARKLGKL